MSLCPRQGLEDGEEPVPCAWRCRVQSPQERAQASCGAGLQGIVEQAHPREPATRGDPDALELVVRGFEKGLNPPMLRARAVIQGVTQGEEEVVPALQEDAGR